MHTPRLMNPHVMNMFWIPLVSIHGVMAKGMPMQKALRMNAIAVKASPVIYHQQH